MVETMRTDILLLKNTGNTNLKNGKFLDAIIWYVYLTLDYPSTLDKFH